MLRAAAFVFALLQVPGALAQDLGGNLFSGFPSGIQGSFSGTVASGFQSGFGSGSPRTLAQTQDFTLGGTGEIRPSMLLGQPSNFQASVAINAPTGGPIVFDNGPAQPLTFDNGPAGPLD